MSKVYNIHNKDAPDDAVYCGRGSRAGNPFIIGKDGSRDEVCDKFEKWAPRQKWWPQLLKDLKGKDLLCFCKPKRCHCDFILRRANEHR